MTRFQMLRLIWIDAWLERSGLPLNRRHLEVTFDLSTPQVSADFALFMARHPTRMTYDRSIKAYLPRSGSSACYEPWMHEAVVSALRAATAMSFSGSLK